MINYNNEYKAYYENLRGKIKKTKVKEDMISNFGKEITPKKRDTQFKGYSGSYKAYGMYSTNRDGYKYGNKSKEKIKKFGYIDKMILKLIVTLILVLLVFIFKISPNENVKVIYESFDKQINESYDMTFTKNVFNKVGIDIEEVMEVIENKTTEVMKGILE